MTERKKPQTFQYNHERLRIDDSDQFFPVANTLLANGFVVWHERVTRPGRITDVDIEEDFVCYCRLQDSDLTNKEAR
jgi:hypothetical protein